MRHHLGVRRFAAITAAALAFPAAAHAQTAVVDVSVATLWKAPNLYRTLDRPSIGNPVDPRAWSRNLATAELRRWLVPHVQTQALYGQRVVVLERRGAWTKVAVVDEPDPQDPNGYPGWLPTKQLSFAPAAPAQRIAIVTAPTVRLRGPDVELSFATQLPLLREEGDAVVVRTPRGDEGVLPQSAVRLERTHPSGAQIVATARRFLGDRYLWGGLSSFGFDCSGIIWAAYRSYGVTIPRDADPQFRGPGTPVPRNALRPGDLVFYGTQSYVHHVAIYAGGGRMLEAPDSAHRVRVVPMRWRGYVGARRYS
jgi:gamma-D-glutamyl-L-lysine dipeptidyl-peptidase